MDIIFLDVSERFAGFWIILELPIYKMILNAYIYIWICLFFFLLLLILIDTYM